MSSEKYLELRGSTWWFRRKVPLAVIPQFQHRKEIRHSLGTTIRSEAVKLARLRAVELDQAFETALARERERLPKMKPIVPVTLTPELIRFVCERWIQAVVLSNDQDREQGFADVSYDDMAVNLQEVDPLLREARARAQTEVVDPALTTFLHLNGLQVSPGDALYRKLRYEFLNAVSTAHEVVKRRHAGEQVPTSTYVPVEAYRSQTEAHLSGSRTSMDALYTLWEQQVKDRPYSTLVSFNAVRKEFKAFHPEAGQDIRLITRTMVLAYRDHLLQSLQPKTVEKKLGLLCALLQVATDRELLPRNPASRITVPKPKVMQVSRLPYSTEDLRTIVGSALYQEDFTPSKRSGEAAARWIPLLGMFTGARLEELAQLNVSDIQHDAVYGYYIHISDISDEGSGNKTLKTESSRRIVPIHAKLIDAGLIRYWQRCKADKHSKLFPELIPDKRGKYSAGWSKWWSQYSRDVMGMTDKRKVFHSFRHGFKDICRECGIGEDVHDALTGHAGGGVGRRYGSRQFPRKALFEAMQQFAIDVEVPIIEAMMA